MGVHAEKVMGMLREMSRHDGLLRRWQREGVVVMSYDSMYMIWAGDLV